MAKRILKNYYKWSTQMWSDGWDQRWDVQIHTLYVVGSNEEMVYEQEVYGCGSQNYSSKDLCAWYKNNTFGKSLLRVPRYGRLSVENLQNKGLKIQSIKQGLAYNRKNVYSLWKVGLTDMVSGLINYKRCDTVLGSWVESKTKSVYVSASEIKQWLNLSSYGVADLYVNVIQQYDIKNRKWCKLLLILQHVKTNKQEPSADIV